MNRLKAILAVSACALALASTAASAESFNIPAGDLKMALDLYASQSGTQLAISGDAVKGTQTQGVKGNLSANDALTRILAGTGFIARDLGGSLAIIRNKQSHLEIQPLHLAQASPNTGRIEEVLVTARRREEAVENIPISITALTSEDLKNFGVRNIADLEGVVPGLNLGGGGNGVKKDMNPFIRGVGQRETKVTLDPAVATYIDGIYIGRAAGAMMDVVDVDNIQVLRGPQGTLFGRNATGGALSVTLKKPNNSWEAQVSANIGNYGRRDLMGSINIPFVEDLVMGRFMISSVNSNGYFTNVVDNSKWGGDNRVTGIAQLRIMPTNNITVDLLGERTRIRETPRPQKCTYVKERHVGDMEANLGGYISSGFATLQTVFLDMGYAQTLGKTIMHACDENNALPQSQFASDMAIGNDLMPKARYWVDTSTAGGTVNWDVGDVGPVSGLAVKSISAWRQTKQIADEDLDAVALPVILRLQPHQDTVTQISQELQLSGRTLNDRLFFSTGLYYFHEETPDNVLLLSGGVARTEYIETFQFTCNYIPAPAPCSMGQTLGFEPVREKLETNNKSLAWYGQVDFDITSEFQISGGLRWTQEKRWSRYSKGGIDPISLMAGPYYDVRSSQLLGTMNVYHPITTPISPMLNWEFFPYIGDELSKTDAAWTPMVSLKYKAGERTLQALALDQAMVYATYSVGFHSGGVTAGAFDVNANGTADPQIFRPEKVKNYEIGAKLTGFDRRVQANLAAFYMDYTDMQVTAVASKLGIPIPYIDNVGGSVIQGVEAELVVMPTEDWRIVFNGSYTDADIKEWQARITPLPLFGGPPPPNSFTILDRSDEPLPRVPRWQFFAATDYTFRLPEGDTITPLIAARYTSKIFHGFDRGSFIDGLDAVTGKSVTFLDGRITWVSGDGKMEAALWGKNLTNVDDYLVGGIPLADVIGGVGQVYNNPRTFGLTFTYHFGE